MSWTITKEFHFSAAHILHGLPDDHPCGRLHGHNYIARIELHSDNLDKTGFVFDYRAFDPFKQWVDDTLDHRNLNHVMPDTYTNPTAELIGHWLHREFLSMVKLPPGITVSVAISETPKTWSTYRFDSAEVAK